MFTHKRTNLPKNTVELEVTIPKAEVEQGAKEAFKALQARLTVEGFRKGKVPDTIAKKHITQDSAYQEYIQTELPKIYNDIVKKENLLPIMSPKVELTKAKQGEDWVIKITVALKPTVDLGDYKKALKNAKTDQKKGEIWTPGKSQEPEKNVNPEAAKQQLLNVMLAELLKTVKFEISDLVVEAELENRLGLLMDDIRKIGLTVESYLKSKNITIEDLRTKYRNEILETYKLEFALSEIAEKEGIKVEQTDLDKLFANIKDEKERKAAMENSYMYASILRKQKALDYILGL